MQPHRRYSRYAATALIVITLAMLPACARSDPPPTGGQAGVWNLSVWNDTTWQ